MRSFEEYWKAAVPSFIKSSEELGKSDLDETQKKLYGLILQVFSFSANTTIKLDKETQESVVPILKDIEDHLSQFSKLKLVDTDL